MQEGKKNHRHRNKEARTMECQGLHSVNITMYVIQTSRGQRWRLEKQLNHLWRSLDSEPRSVDGGMSGWPDDGWMGRWMEWMGG